MNPKPDPDFAVRLDTPAGSLLFVEGSAVARSILKRGIHDPGVEYFMKKYRHHLFPFFDVGANVGLFSVIGAKTANSKEEVVAFEPELKNLELLALNLSSMSARNVRTEPIAVGRSDGVLELGVIDCGLSKKSKINPKQVNCRSLSSYINENRVVPRFVKIDIEGAEIDVIEGFVAAECFDEVILEMEFSWRDQNQFMDRFLELLPIENRDFEFVLSPSEEQSLEMLASNNVEIQNFQDARTGQKFIMVLARDIGQLNAIMQALEDSTVTLASRKWELCITPKQRTIVPTRCFVPGFVAT